jgi:hypothetical protein
VIRKAGLALLPLLLVGCSGTVKTVPLTAENTARPMAVQPLQCAYRLQDVRDERPDGDSAGGLGWNKLVMTDAVSMVRSQLLQRGLQPAESSTGKNVVVTLKRMYVAPAMMSKLAIVVYQVKLDDDAPYLIRAQVARGNWNGSQAEALSVFSDAMRNADERTITWLNQRCGATL